jgi:hypothetical protein
MADTTKPEKRTINRSTAYPGITLEKAIEATKLLRDNLGLGPYSRDSAATALGYKAVSGASIQKISACVQFGLLTRKSNAYSQSDLADKMFRFISEEERVQAIKEAVQRPTLYAKLISEFNGRALPKMLDNVLVRNYGITERVAKDVANVFEKSAQFAGLLQNGIITVDASTQLEESPEGDGGPVLGDEPGGVSDAPPSANTDQVTPPQTPAPAPAAPAGYLTIAIPDTDVKILFPMSYAYDLSIGSFKTGIEALAKNIKDIQPVTQDDESAAAA